MLLADAAQAVEGKLYVLGGGWSLIGPEPQPSAIALYIKVPWDRTNTKHRLLVELLDLDGAPLLVETPMGRQALRLETEFEVGRPAGIKPGTALDLALALNFPPLPLPSGGYEWRLSINDETAEDWRLPFTVKENSAPKAG
jgi:hypothetical protein